MTSVERAAALIATAGVAGIVLFQLALALGAPLGRAAWGGTQAGVLPAQLRVASAVAALVWAGAVLIVVRRSGLGLGALPPSLGTVGIWVLFGLLLLGTVMNVASSSPWERFFWAPYALAVAALCLVVARS
jgi:hypothetical protein